MALTATVSATTATEAGQQDTPSSSSKVVMVSTGLSTPKKTATNSQMSPKPPSSSAAPSPLDALLSPTDAPENGMQSVMSIAASGPSTSVPRAKEDAPTRSPGESLDGDMQELSLEEVDDARFSTVPLSAPPPLSPSPPLTRKSCRLSSISRNDGTEDEQSLQTPRTSFSYFQDARGTKVANGKLEDGPANAHGSANGLPGADFILARLEKDTSKGFRSSLDGKAKLKEEFDSTRKLAEEQEEKTKEIDWDFWGLVMADFGSFAQAEPQQLASAIRAGIPPSLRGMVWQLMSGSKDTELERIYATLLKQTSPHEKSIQRDLGRTFPHHAFFMDGHGIGQESLFNVLKAYSLYDPECGYCQGLPFIVAPLLLVSPDEEAFCQLVRLMHSYGLRAHFLPEMPGLQLRLFQFDRLIEEVLPVLHTHFLRQGVKSSMYCSQWFLTLFAYRFPLEMVFRIFDHILANGIEAIFSFSILLLHKNEAALLKLNFDGCLDYLKTSLLDSYQIEDDGEQDEPQFRVDDFVRDASRVRITPFQLDNYAAEYEELRKAQTAHLVEMDNMRNENRILKAQVKNLEQSLAAVSEEHCGVIKQLVMAKIEKEEMEGELVKYKLLYAELMHAKEESQPSRGSGWSFGLGSRNS